MEDWPGRGSGSRRQCYNLYTFTSPCWLAVTDILSYSYTHNLVVGPRLGTINDVWPSVAQGTLVHIQAELVREEGG